MSPICGIGRGGGPPRRTEATNGGERTMGKGQATRGMCTGVKGRSEPVPEPPNGVARVKQFPFDLDG